MLEVEHTIIHDCLRIDSLLNEVEQLDAPGIDLHQTIAPCVDGIHNRIFHLLLCLRTVVVRIVTYLHLLDIHDGRTGVLDSQVTVCLAFCTLGLHGNLCPFAGFENPLSISTGTVNLVTREGDCIRSILIGLHPECRGELCERIHFKTFDDANISCRTDLQCVLVVIFGNGCTSFLDSAMEFRGVVVVDSLAFYILNRNLYRRREIGQPFVRLVSIGEDRTAVNLITDLFHMGEQIAHVEEVHHTLGVDNVTGHQRGTEESIIAVGDTSGMSQFLFVEV